MTQTTSDESAAATAPAAAVWRPRLNLLSRRAPQPANDLASRVRNGVPVASFFEYADAEAAVETLTEAALPVGQMAIVGADLRVAEDVHAARPGGHPAWV